jgi:hypothetical protein
LYETTGPTWRDGSILLVAGRVDHRGEEVSLLADLVLDWDDAVARGPEAFARDVAAGDRGRGRAGPRPGNGHVGNGNGNGNGHGRGPAAGRPLVPVGPGVGAPPAPAAAAVGAPGRDPSIPYVSPLRPRDDEDPGAGLPAIAPAEPVATYQEPPGAVVADPDADDDPALPDEARARATDQATARTEPTEAGIGRVLHVRFSSASPDRSLAAMRTFGELVRSRPGDTRVLIHIDVGGSAALPMELRPVAYDAELLAEIQRRLGDGVVELRLA